VAAVVLILVPQLALSFWPARRHWIARLCAALVAFPILGAVVAAIYGLSSGYWSSR
jgi:hypothetical protein